MEPLLVSRDQEMAQGLPQLSRCAMQQSWWCYYCLVYRPVRVFKVQDSLTEWVAPGLSPAMHTASRLPRFLSSQLVSTDANFQAIYDAVMIQVLLFIVYVIIRDSYKAGRWVFCDCHIVRRSCTVLISAGCTWMWRWCTLDWGLYKPLAYVCVCGSHCWAVPVLSTLAFW